VLSDWLIWESRIPSSYKKFALIEIGEKISMNNDIKSDLRRLLIESRVDPSLLKEAAIILGWQKVEGLFATALPTEDRIRKGDFGETLMNETLEDFFGYKIPISKLRFAIGGNVSPPGTDTVAIKVKDGTISEVCFVESKTRTSSDRYSCLAAVEGCTQLNKDYQNSFSEIISFVLHRLYEKKDPMYRSFLNYLRDRNDLASIEEFRLGLIWDHAKWNEKVLENLENDEVNVPRLIVHRVRIKDLALLIEDLYRSLGVREIIDDD